MESLNRPLAFCLGIILIPIMLGVAILVFILAFTIPIVALINPKIFVFKKS